MDLITIVIVTAAVLGVLLVVLTIIAVIVLLPPVRRALAERSASKPHHPEPGDEGAGRP